MKFDFCTLEFVDVDQNIQKIAVVGSDGKYSWKELRIEVDNIKNELLKINIPKGHPVIIYGHKEKKFIANIIACISLQLPYIPIDDIYPSERVRLISQELDSGIMLKSNEIIVNQNKLTTSYYDENDPIIYILFTSGSTGKPKGVQISKSSIQDFILWLKKDFNFCENNVFMNQAPFSFDLSVYELMGFLNFGGSILLNSRNSIDNIDSFFDRLVTYKCDTWVSTPSFISKFLLSNDFCSEAIPSLQNFIFCGETLPASIVKRIYGKFPNVKIINSYGPTEATVATTMIELTPEIVARYDKSLPVGFPKDTTEISVINPIKEGGKLVGEIELTGNNVSIGYFNNKSLNQEKFSIKQGSRSFKTGDYGYFEDNMLFFTARKDGLIKLHGFRIELEEIDKIIMNCQNVIHSLTIPLKRKNEVIKLVSFIQASQFDMTELKNEIKKYLPFYMVPSEIIQIKEYPYTTNYKIDNNALLKFYKSS
jgi:D-alanine--poly(phosphoribitol) ligase subunit 1